MKVVRKVAVWACYRHSALSALCSGLDKITVSGSCTKPHHSNSIKIFFFLSKEVNQLFLSAFCAVFGESDTSTAVAAMYFSTIDMPQIDKIKPLLQK